MNAKMGPAIKKNRISLFEYSHKKYNSILLGNNTYVYKKNDNIYFFHRMAPL